MIDPQLLRKKDPALLEGMAKRGYEIDWAEFERLEAARAELQTKCESMRAEKNRLAALVGQAKAKGMDGQTFIAQGAELAARIGSAEAKEREALAAVEAFCLSVPNIPDAAVPFGAGEEDNVIVRVEGEPAPMDFVPKDHLEIAEGLGGSRSDLAAKIAGSRFCLLAGQVAKLQRALEGFMLDEHAAAGYVELYVPLLVGADAMRGTGQLPKFEQDLFKTTDGRYLIPTAEVPVTNLLAGEMLDAAALPLKFCAKTPCFRSEAGSAGRDARGLIRQHQFEKVEIVRFERAEASAEAHEAMLADAENILRKLGLPYRVSLLCGKDLGFSAAVTYDLEVWVPAQGKYREISSVSNFKDFQSRRMGLRAKDEAGKRVPVHTLNGSGLAVGRTLVAVLENFQDELGRVRIPEVLRPRMGGAEWLEPDPVNWGSAPAQASKGPKP